MFSSLNSWADKDSSLLPPVLRPLHHLIRIILITLKEYGQNDLSLRSSALTYAILLSLVPMLAMGTAVIKGMGGGDQLRSAAYNYLETLESSRIDLPGTPHDPPSDSSASTPEKESGGMTGHLRTAVDQLFDYVDKTNFAALGTFGILGILLSVLLVLSQIEGAMNHIWRVKNGRPLLRRITDYLALLILLPISINVAFAASAFLQNPKLSGWMDIVLPFGWLQSLILKPIPVIFIGATFYTMYVFFPNTKVKNRNAMLGALLAAICWFGIQNLYISLQVGVAKYNAIYGSFATLPLFLVWIYLGWLFILLGGQIAWVLQHLDTYRLNPVSETAAIRLSCAYDLMQKTQEGFAENSVIDPMALTTLLAPHYRSREIRKTLGILQDKGLLHPSEKDGRLLPGGMPGAEQSQAVMKAILGEAFPDSYGGKEAQSVLKTAEEKHPFPSSPIS